MGKTIRLRTVLIVAITLLVNEKAFGERLNLGEGLDIEKPENASILFETIPSFNPNKKMLQRRNGDKLQYFISIERLSRNTTSSERYFERLLRDISDASVESSFKILDQGEYWTLANVRGSYVDFTFTPAGGNRPQRQIAHFLTNTYRNYVAIAVLVDSAEEQQMRDDAIALFSSAAISTLNPPLNPSNSTTQSTPTAKVIQ